MVQAINLALKQEMERDKDVVLIGEDGFIYAGIEQLFSHASRIRSRSRGRYSCPLVIRTPYGIGIKPPELHSESSEALFCHMPGIKVVVPSSPYNAKGLLISAIRDPDPVIFLEPTRLYRLIKEEVPETEYTIPLGKAKVVHEATRNCGFGAELSAFIAEEAMLHLKAPIIRITGLDAVLPMARLEDYYAPSKERIVKALKKVMEY